MKTTFRLAAILTITLASSHSAFADKSAYFGDRDPTAEACYKQTVLATRGVDATTLSVKACEKALYRGPHTRAHKSTLYHNRALIELAMGQDEAARRSMEFAVDLASEVGPQHITLAQLAFRQGDFKRAGQLYDAIMATDNAHPMIINNRELLQRNHTQLAQLEQSR